MNRIQALLFAIFLVFFLPSCDKDGNDWRKETKTKRTLLIYAVASNNLSSYLIDDKNEMKQIASEIQGLGSEVRVLLYSVASQSAEVATISELTKTPSGFWEFSELETYDRETFSTDPKRMRQVFSDIMDIAPAEKYGLIFWSHGTGWLPNFTSHEVSGSAPVMKSYGIDKYQGVTDYCDIDELASAIPDRMFDYVWFDLCYMMGVEVLYQLRDKCEYVAGYPTEDWSSGMNYETTLPMLVAPDPDLAGAGKAFFDYYNDGKMAVTVTVMKTAGCERLAKAASEIYAAGSRPSSASGLMNYSRMKSSPFYDFGQFTKKYLDPSDYRSNALIAEFDDALADMTVYAACSTKNFSNVEDAFDPEQYSGLSCHFPGSGTANEEAFYSSLDWPQDVNP